MPPVDRSRGTTHHSAGGYALASAALLLGFATALLAAARPTAVLAAIAVVAVAVAVSRHGS